MFSNSVVQIATSSTMEQNNGIIVQKSQLFVLTEDGQVFMCTIDTDGAPPRKWERVSNPTIGVNVIGTEPLPVNHLDLWRED